ncbi:MAG: nitrite/sulfite reductase [Dehalococcoidia bacterium]|nr:nitrite/sulfite reductase [Dehalococcoidia bacterium]
MTITKSPRQKAKGVIPYLPEEIDVFQKEAERYLAGGIEETDFIKFRLRQGVYGQRQPDAQMIRVKIPFGGLSADQLDALGAFAEEYAPLKKGHITTRECFQFHHVKLDRTSDGLRLLGQSGLTTREACGNTVRNVAGCARAGVCPGETFDPTPYVGAYARYFVRHPLTQAFPRKIKSAFSGCDSDCAMTAIHDMGFIARMKTVDGVQRKGFKMVVGGGTSIMPRIAPTLYEFVAVEDFLKICEAVFQVFNKSDELRKNRMKARIKFLVDRIGIDDFRKLVEAELQAPWAKKTIDVNALLWEDDEASEAPAAPSTNGHKAHGSVPPEFSTWLSTNVREQRQGGYRVVSVTVVQGDLTPAQFRGLAQIARQYAAGRARLTQEQNLVFRWVRQESLLDVWKALSALSLGEGHVNEITDVVTCPGTDSCKLGITASMGMGRALRSKLMDMHITDPALRQLHVKASGCPNGCGQHHIANIGFHGAAIKSASGQQVPAYEIFIGGNADGAKGAIRFGQRVSGRVPSKRAPEFMERVLKFYTDGRQPEESFNQFVDRVGPKAFEPLLAGLKDVGPLNRDTITTYMDWDKTVPYRVERGEGECAV